MIKVVLAIALVGAVSAELSCEDCSHIGGKISHEMTTPEQIHHQVEMIKNPVCHKAPEFWHAIAMELFNAKHGWFAPSNLCGDVCAKKTIVGAPLCHDCTQRLDMSLKAMEDPEKQMEVVAAFGESDFCMGFGEDVGMCMEGLELVIPTAMHVLAGNGHQHAHDFCVHQVECQEHGLF